MLDSGERFHLAIQEMQHGSPEKAIEHLKSCLEEEPENAKALYLLGALHAQIGMYERSIEEMAQAIEIDGTLSIARFQLGLLHFTSGNNSEAENAWGGLDSLGDTNPLYLFKRGLLHTLEEEYKSCIDDLEKGIALNTDNEALSNDMRKMIIAARKALNEAKADSLPTDGDSIHAKKTSSLSAYTQDND